MTTQVHLVAGLAYGDEGKGAIVDALVRRHKATMVVRYNGGSQCAHNVVTPDGKHHTFAQFGSGSFVPGVKTYLSQYMLINPLNMMCEAEHLSELGINDIWYRTTVDAKALIITPYQKAVNRIMEIFRGHAKHGSCGQGIGMAREDHIKFGEKVLFAGDLKSELVTKNKLEFLRKESLKKITTLGCMADPLEARIIFNSDSVDWTWQQYRHWPAQVLNDNFGVMLEDHEQVVFEGAQGVLLDETFGQAPYYTWTDTTFNNAERMLKDVGFNGKTTKVGVLRTYFTRHGAGPFPTEDKLLQFPEPHNSTNQYQDNFRQGRFDWERAAYGFMACGGVDYIALNHVDVTPDVLSFSIKGRLEKDFAPVGIVGTGPTCDDKIFAEVAENSYT